jgi:uncharacterized membrane protein required for colicin V production
MQWQSVKNEFLQLKTLYEFTNLALSIIKCAQKMECWMHSTTSIIHHDMMISFILTKLQQEMQKKFIQNKTMKTTKETTTDLKLHN